MGGWGVAWGVRGIDAVVVERRVGFWWLEGNGLAGGVNGRGFLEGLSTYMDIDY